MPTTRLPLTLASLGLLALASASCSGGDGADKVLGSTLPHVTLEEGVNLSAAPDTIILDPNDAAAPRDPVTMELIGSSTITALILDATLDSVSGADVTFTSDAGTLASGGAAIATDANGESKDTLAVTESGPREITVTGTSGAFTKTLAVVVDIAPTANAGEDQTADCGTPVTLDGSASTDPNSTEGTNDDIASYQWFLGDSLIAEGETADVILPIGVNLVTLKVTDTVGASDTADVTITVVDTTPPVVSLHMSPDKLWPPNHRMKTVQAMLDIQDCDPNTTVELVSVTSNEPDNGLGDGDTSGDIAGASLGTDDRSVQVRAERSGTGTGRVYTFVYRVTDSSGNSTDATATVTVPHDLGH
jgi:hypothetical protein